MPSITNDLGITGKPESKDGQRLEPLVSYHIQTMSIGFLVDEETPMIWRGPMVTQALEQLLKDTNWRDIDYLVVDLPPGTGDIQLTLAQKIPVSGAIIVTTPQEISLADVRKSINFCKTVEMGIFGLIENMSGFTCPHCDQMIELFGSGGGEKTAHATGVKFLGRIPFDPEMVSCGDTGISFQAQHQESTVTKAFADISDNIAKNI